MFLSPLALWLAPFIAAPLLIHFLGRIRPKTVDFPSLLPVRGQLTRAMRRHRLKNWLQLLLRTLILTALVLAAADPVRRFRGGWTPPASATLLLHNGAYAACPAQVGNVWARQQRLRRDLDSLTGGHVRAENLFPGAPSPEPLARFGRYSEALTRLLSDGKVGASHHLYIPVFDWRDLEEIAEPMARALGKNPGLRVVLVESPEARKALSPFRDLHLAFPKEGIAALRARCPLPPPGGKGGNAHLALWTPEGGTPREIPIGDSVEILLPLPQSGWLCGTLSLPASAAEKFAYPAQAIAVRVPPPATLCHVGNPFMSLASLGKGGARLRVLSFPDGRDFTGADCDVLYLADPKGADASLLSRVAETIRRGGKAVIGVGRNTDPALLNRNLLVPLGIGRLAALEQHTPMRIAPAAKTLAKIGWHAGNWGEPGEAKTQITLLPDSGTSVLLAAGDAPILAYRRVGPGALLLWTTDVNDPDWTDLALGPWVALAHQAFLSGTWTSRISLRQLASDSVLTVSVPEDAKVRMEGPDGNVERIDADPAGWRAGPFNRLGLYRVETGTDTGFVAVTLAENRGEIERAGWEEGRRRFLSAFGAFGDFRDRITLRRADDDAPLYGGMRLRLPMLLLAALLLFIEGAVSLRLMPAQAARD